MALRTAIYARQSLDRSGEGAAVSRQLDECRRLAEANDWRVIEEYVDNDVSASAAKPRKEWTRLLAALDAGEYDVLICWHTDRLYRRLRDLVSLVEIAEQRALRIATVRAADLDLSTPAGRMLAGMLGAAQRYEVEQKSARQIAANVQARKAGRMPWTRRPFGYDLDDHGAVVVVDDEALELRRSAAAVLDGETLASIARDLDGRGVVTTTGGPWSVNALKRLLVNPRHAGVVSHRGEKVGEGGWPAIFEASTHAQLVAVLTDPTRRTAADTKVKHLMSGLAICGRCDAKLFATPMGPKTDRYLAYRCRTAHLARRADLVDEVVVGAVLERLGRPDALAALSRGGDDAATLTEELAMVRGRIDELAEMFADGAISAKGLREAAAKLRAREVDLSRRLAALDGDRSVASLAGAADITAAWAALTVQRQRDVVDLLCAATVLPVTRGARFAPDQVRIDWRG